MSERTDFTHITNTEMLMRNGRFKTLVLIFVPLVICCALPVQARYGGGAGEPNDPYLIYTASQMNAIGADPNDWDKCFKLMKDIDLSSFTGTAFNIIGTNYPWHPFTGVFDGNGHTISSFNYASIIPPYIGLFALIQGATIKELGLIDPNVDAGIGDYVGSLVGYNYYGIIKNCYADGGRLLGRYGIGGLVGQNEGVINNCCSKTPTSGENCIGGLVGQNVGTVSDCYSTGAVLGRDSIGGLVGYNVGTIGKCYSTGGVLGNWNVGGLVGINDGDVFSSFWDVDTGGQTTSDGGMGKTTAQMKMVSTFIDWVCCDCEPVWTINEGQDYPRLWWENAPGELITAPSYGGGRGEPNDPYLIYTAKQFIIVGMASCNWDKHFKLMADIDLAGFPGTSLKMIGDRYYDAGWVEHPFTGVFDGNDHTISNFTYDSNDCDCAGLFGYVADGRIKNLGLIDPNIYARYMVGSLVGMVSNASITNCYVEGARVAGWSDVGGLVGQNVGTISNCYSTGSVTGDDDVGGLVGCNYDTITDCYSAGSVSGIYRVGGLLGLNDGTIKNCYSTAGIAGETQVGGLAGYNEAGEIIASFWDIETSGQNTSAGGTGLPTEQMQTATTFMLAGWGCSYIWTIDEGNDYPHLLWEQMQGEPISTPSYSGGTGGPNSPYLIYTAEHLNMIGLFPCDLDKHFKLMADIDLSGFTGQAFNIIGFDSNNPFSGVFNGSDHTISNFSYTSTNTDNIGLFGYVYGPNAEIKNLGLIDPDVDAVKGDGVGSLVSINGGNITNCYVEGGSVVGFVKVGGLVGHNDGKISNCYSNASVSGSGKWYTVVGGLVGENDGNITNCHSTGDISGTYETGGLVGYNYHGTITNSDSSGEVSGFGLLGGLVGANDGGTISNCSASGTIAGEYNVGGLVGWNYLDGTIDNCYSTGSASGGLSSVGGLVGNNYYGIITYCYSTAAVAGGTQIGGLIGYNDAGEVIGSFWDIETSGQNISAGGTGLPTEQMKTMDTFADAGWDFNTPVWTICEAIDYPRLICQFVIGDFDDDEDVDLTDFAILATRWLKTDGSFWCGGGKTDLTNDGNVNSYDLKTFVDNWLASK